MASDGKSTEPLYFWREHEQPFGFLSQWYSCKFDHDGVTFNSTEQWMMWNKAKVFRDEDIAKQILATSSPRKQKGLGRKVKNFDNKEWDRRKYDVVRKGNMLKFTQGKTTFPDSHGAGVSLKKCLLETSDRELIEASPYDRVWGIGYTAKDATGSSRKDWGENLLGKALMEVRDELKKDENTNGQTEDDGGKMGSK